MDKMECTEGGFLPALKKSLDALPTREEMYAYIRDDKGLNAPVYRGAHDVNSTYISLDTVEESGIYYQAKKYVPAGVDLIDSDYWFALNISTESPTLISEIPFFDDLNYVDTPTELSLLFSDNRLLVDNSRQINMHKSGDADGANTTEVPDNTFIVKEKSRSYDYKVGALEKVLFIGDSLTALNDTNSTAIEVAKRIASIHGNQIKGLSYLSCEMTSNSAKHNLVGASLTHSGFTFFEAVVTPYTDDKRKYSPDGKGAYIYGGTGAQFIKYTLTNTDISRYQSFKVFYQTKPGGGTFTARARGGDNTVTIDTDTTLGIGIVDVDKGMMNGALEQYDIWLENVTGDVTIYGVLPSDISNEGITVDIFAQSGKMLNEYIITDQSGFQSYLSIAQPDTCIINLGTNDSSALRTDTQFIQDLDTLRSTIDTQVPNIKYSMINPNNMQWTNFPGINYHKEYEAARRKYCRDNKINFIDLPSELGSFNYLWTTDLMKDGTHPNRYGAQVFAAAIFERLRNNMTPIMSISSTPTSVHQIRFRVSGGVITDVVKSGLIDSVVRNAAGDFTVTHSIGNDQYTISSSVGASNRIVNIQGQSAALLIDVFSTSYAMADPSELTITLFNI